MTRAYLSSKVLYSVGRFVLRSPHSLGVDRVLIVQGVVLSGPVRVAIAPLAGGRLRLIGAAARIDKYSDHYRNLAAVHQVVHYNLRADIAFRSHESLPIVVD